MAKSRETALYYDPEGGERAQQVKTVLVCMGARIKNIAAADGRLHARPRRLRAVRGHRGGAGAADARARRVYLQTSGRSAA